MSKHSKQKNPISLGRKVAMGATIAIGGAVVPATFAGSASAATDAEWDRVAACESSGNWAINTGNGFYGGVQFTSSTWAAYGGRAFAPQANQATKAQQIVIAERVLSGGYNGNAPQGKGAWPACGVGLSNTPYTGGYTPPTKPAPPAPPKARAATTPSSTGVTQNAQEAINWALGHVNTRDLYYVYGGEGPRGYDCSGFLQGAWAAAGVSIPRDTYGMEAGLPEVSQSNMRPGDLVLLYFQGAIGPAPNHVVMYIGDGKIVEMSGSRGNSVSTLANRGGSITAVVRPDASAVPADPAPPADDDPAPTPAPDDDPAPTPAPDDDPAPTPAPEGGEDYTVKAGDTLSGIAEAKDVRGGWPALYAANREAVGPDPDVIDVGLVLKIPSSDPYEFSGLPSPNHTEPSAVPLQEELKRVGYMDDSVRTDPNYGPKTQAAVAAFYADNRDISSGGYDVVLGPIGWDRIMGMETAEGGGSSAPAPDPASSSDVTDIVNSERAAEDLDPVAEDAALNAYAKDWAEQMASESRMYHSGLDFEGSPRGENVASGQDDAAAVMAAWMDSPGHRANILGEDYTKTGVAMAKDAAGREYWAQVFAGGGSAKEEPAPKDPPAEEKPAPSTGGYQSPVDSYISQQYGNPGNYSLGYHTGADYHASSGTPVHSAGPGTVVASDTSSAYGTNVQIKHTDGKYTLYAHLSGKTVNVGDTVSGGELIGYVGSTGNSTGPHLHFEVRTQPAFGAGNFLNPVAWLASHGVTA